MSMSMLPIHDPSHERGCMTSYRGISTTQDSDVVKLVLQFNEMRDKMSSNLTPEQIERMKADDELYLDVRYEL